ncbi:methionine--tRNA ligase [Starmerella bacillaris]|uniref:Probable methionine--tRNA ligase, mitochondrial n=1 Tax=Starmerella bacillaris TaxID=1247836 RepID=A0AAV5RJF0_STABA|nr:methionine--tRNA ligase [Starmerella bacillaris]
MKTLLTTPIFYVNAAPHLGHLYSIVLTDVARRWKLLNGVDSVMSTGTDEHGTKIARAAESKNMAPKQHADILSAQFQKLSKMAGANATFIRTTSDLHHKHATDLWNKLKAKEVLYRGQHSGFYCVSDECFYSPDELIKDENGNLLSRLSGNPVEWHEEQNWFFQLSKFQNKLIELFETQKDFVLPPSRQKSILDELKHTKLKDLSVSRPKSRVSWGVPVPKDSSLNSASGEMEDTMYVWFDALANYLTASTINGGCEPFIHVVGKDIQKFHTIFWPAFLMAAGEPLPEKVVIHSHWTVDGVKMSKSKGNVVDPFSLIESLGVDGMRYALCIDANLENDSAFNMERAIERHNVNLVNKWSNLASRVCSPAFNLPQALKRMSDLKTGKVNDNPKLLEEINALVENDALLEKCSQAANAYEFGKYLQVLNNAAMDANERLQLAEPWKNENKNKDESIFALVEAIDTCRIIAILLQPVCPNYAFDMLDRLQIPKERRNINYAQRFADLDYIPDFKPVVTRIK